MGGVRRLLAVLLVTAVLASCAHGEQRPPGGPRRIPADISAWNAIPGFAHLRRFWERKDLAPAYQHMGDPVHAARLLSKLDAGKRIVSVAIGSSFVANQAGCFHPSMSALYDLGVLPNPHIYPLPGSDPSRFGSWEEGSFCDSGGYMEAMMATINATWPHTEHVFLNHGTGGLGLHAAMQASCLDAYIPRNVDIVFLDTTTVITPPYAIEYLARKFLSLPSKPLVLLLSNAHICQHVKAIKSTLAPDPGSTCSDACLLMNDPASCGLLEPEVIGEVSAVEQKMILSTVQSVAAHYNIPHISLLDLLTKTFYSAAMLEKLPHEAGSALPAYAKWQMTARFYRDSVHFQKCGIVRMIASKDSRLEQSNPPLHHPNGFGCVPRYGELLVADLLVNYLVVMQAEISMWTEAKRSGMPPEEGPLPSAVHEEATVVYESRCYGIAFDDAAEAAKSVGQEGAREELQRMKPGDAFHLGEMGEGNFGAGTPQQSYQQRYNPLPSLNVTKLDGFQMMTHYRGKSGDLKFKPGYVSDREDAVMEIQVRCRRRCGRRTV
mmetsp:Transcript_31523/g.93991  ORF Transcript_31523/g.93991 Transcript_31523/m.93991 type:complete len:548 (-) Transcript_31523:269-1912(-)